MADQKFRILKSYCQGREEEVTEEQARASLSGYYPDVQGVLRRMWDGETFKTAGHDYRIERLKKKAS